MTERRRGARRAVLVALVGLAGLAIARPWTIRPIPKAPAADFDPEAYVASIWTKVLEDAERTAVDVVAVLDPRAETHDASPTARKAVFVRGTGVVTRVDRSSRVGLARLLLDGSAAGSAALQVGPVLRGTAVRDALDFVRFTDFSNQSDFAAVASTLNDRVLGSVLGPIDVEALAGRTVTFLGAAPLAARRGEAPLEIVPLAIEGGGGDR